MKGIVIFSCFSLTFNLKVMVTPARRVVRLDRDERRGLVLQRRGRAAYLHTFILNATTRQVLAFSARLGPALESEPTAFRSDGRRGLELLSPSMLLET